MFLRIPKITTLSYSRWVLGMVVKAAAIAMLILLAALTIPQHALTGTDAGEARNSAYAVNQILGEAIKNLQTILKEEEGNQVYEALKIRLKDAEALAERAQKALNEGAYQDALNTSLKALSIVKNAAAEISEDEEEQLVAAAHSALRISTVLSGVKNLTDVASAKGYDVSNLRERLEVVSKLLEEARSLSARGDALGAGRKVAESKSMLGHLVSGLNQAYAKEKAKLAEEYVNKILSRIFSAEGVKNKFTEQIEELNISKRHIQAGNLRPAIKQIKEAMKQMQKGLKEDLKKVSDELLKLRKQINDLKAGGVDVEREERLIQEVSKLVEQATAYLEKGDYIAAKMKVVDAEAALRRLR